MQVDLTYVEAAAKAAKAGGVRHFSLVTSKGASARLPAPHFAGLHPLLYLATKGRAEEAAKAQVHHCGTHYLGESIMHPLAGLHPLLYLATKGRAEAAVQAQVQQGPG